MTPDGGHITETQRADIESWKGIGGVSISKWRGGFDAERAFRQRTIGNLPGLIDIAKRHGLNGVELAVAVALRGGRFGPEHVFSLVDAASRAA